MDIRYYYICPWCELYYIESEHCPRCDQVGERHIVENCNGVHYIEPMEGEL